jgi:divalent metal cation (Fe/Co/Zn/Cd) transporter
MLAHQLSLETFGVQSLIEILAAALVLFRFSLSAAEAGVVYDRERYGTRMVGVALILLAVMAAIGAIMDLQAHTGPDTSTYGIAVAGIAAVAMYICWKLKKKAGNILQSPVMLSDAKCSLMCMCLGLLVMVSSFLYMIFPNLWWVDSVCAIMLALFFIRDGVRIVYNTYQESFAGGCGCCQ